MSAVLLLLFAAIFLAPFLESALVRSLFGIFLSLLLISGVALVSPRPLLRRIIGAIALTAIGLHWLQEFQPGRVLDVAASFITLICLISLTLVVLIRVFRDSGAVTTSRVQGAVAAYVLFGITWSILYRFVELCLPGAFSLPATPGMTLAEQRETFAYFSFVTMTTLGYGDVTAVHPVARMFVVFQALVGQLYPATLLARLVSLEISNRPAGTGKEAPPASATETMLRRRKRNPHLTP